MRVSTEKAWRRKPISTIAHEIMVNDVRQANIHPTCRLEKKNRAVYEPVDVQKMRSALGRPASEGGHHHTGRMNIKNVGRNLIMMHTKADDLQLMATVGEAVETVLERSTCPTARADAQLRRKVLNPELARFVSRMGPTMRQEFQAQVLAACREIGRALRIKYVNLQRKLDRAGIFSAEANAERVHTQFMNELISTINTHRIEDRILMRMLNDIKLVKNAGSGKTVDGGSDGTVAPIMQSVAAGAIVGIATSGNVLSLPGPAMPTAADKGATDAAMSEDDHILGGSSLIQAFSSTGGIGGDNRRRMNNTTRNISNKAGLSGGPRPMTGPVQTTQQSHMQELQYRLSAISGRSISAGGALEGDGGGGRRGSSSFGGGGGMIGDRRVGFERLRGPAPGFSSPNNDEEGYGLLQEMDRRNMEMTKIETYRRQQQQQQQHQQGGGGGNGLRGRERGIRTAGDMGIGSLVGGDTEVVNAAGPEFESLGFIMDIDTFRTMSNEVRQQQQQQRSSQSERRRRPDEEVGALTADGRSIEDEDGYGESGGNGGEGLCSNESGGGNGGNGATGAGGEGGANGAVGGQSRDGTTARRRRGSGGHEDMGKGGDMLREMRKGDAAFRQYTKYIKLHQSAPLLPGVGSFSASGQLLRDDSTSGALGEEESSSFITNDISRRVSRQVLLALNHSVASEMQKRRTSAIGSRILGDDSADPRNSRNVFVSTMPKRSSGKDESVKNLANVSGWATDLGMARVDEGKENSLQQDSTANYNDGNSKAINALAIEGFERAVDSSSNNNNSRRELRSRSPSAGGTASARGTVRGVRALIGSYHHHSGTMRTEHILTTGGYGLAAHQTSSDGTRAIAVEYQSRLEEAWEVLKTPARERLTFLCAYCSNRRAQKLPAAVEALERAADAIRLRERLIMLTQRANGRNELLSREEVITPKDEELCDRLQCWVRYEYAVHDTGPRGAEEHPRLYEARVVKTWLSMLLEAATPAAERVCKAGFELLQQPITYEGKPYLQTESLPKQDNNNNNGNDEQLLLLS